MKPTVFVVLFGMAFGATVAEQAPARSAILAKSDDAKKKPKAGPGPTDIDKKVKLSPEGLKFGMTVEEISRLYETVFEKDFVTLYQSVEPGPRMAELDAELADKKKLVMRNKLDFAGLPSGLDDTAFGGEFTYNNSESMTHVTLRTGVERYFFFFGNHLWKVLDLHKLGKQDKLGASYEEVVKKLTKQFGKAPRARDADPSQKRLDQVDWEDKETIIRVIDHGNGKAVLGYIDRKVEENLDRYRSNKGGGQHGVSASVTDATKSDKPDEGPPGAGAKGGKKK
jgi:hypothetical protein